MRTDRTLFTEDYKFPFTKWMAANDFKLLPSTNEYEELRFMKIDQSLEIVSFYKKKGARALTIQGRSAELFTEYLRSLS